MSNHRRVGSSPISRTKLRSPGIRWIPGLFFVYQCFAVLSEIFAVRKTSRICDCFSIMQTHFANKMLTMCGDQEAKPTAACVIHGARLPSAACARGRWRPRRDDIWQTTPAFDFVNRGSAAFCLARKPLLTDAMVFPVFSDFVSHRHHHYTIKRRPCVDHAQDAEHNFLILEIIRDCGMVHTRPHKYLATHGLRYAKRGTRCESPECHARDT